MGLFDRIFGNYKRGAEGSALWKMLTGYAPIWHQFNGKLYESELVRAAINARANHISKLSVQVLGTAQPQLRTVLHRGPNTWQTWSQFLYRLSTILDVQNTAFIVPVFDPYGRVVGIYPVLPSMCEIVDYAGEPWLRCRFANGDVASIELARVGVMTKFQYTDDLVGESNKALTPTMDLINVQNQGITESVKNGATFRFWARVNNFSKAADLRKERQRFNEENLQTGEGGLLLFPNTYSDIKQMENKPFVADAEQMAFIRKNVFEYFGVNEDVLQNAAFGDHWAAFYEGAIEPFAIQFSEVVSAMLYTQKERAQGSGIMATANRLQYMSNTEKLQVSAQMADRGIMNRDEIREIWNLPPLPNGQGQAYTMRGEYWMMNADGTITKKEDDQNEQGSDAEAAG